MKRIIAVIFACCLALPFALAADAADIEISTKQFNDETEKLK